ncbi:MAG: alcohol dehydrogenase catalytic domain-containing protein [Lachnospiraceae bacterium]|jgi:L-iditol 2-dehydrogenase|nr:alcohol dehydrogenase catalytic domain-containing protein [Lachnospiraceae bacterium]
MKAIINYENGSRKVSYMEADTPEPAAGQVRIKVAYCGICGTDLHIFEGDGGYPTKPPVILGHEVSGVVEAVGEGADPSWLGKRVVSETYYHTCGRCMYCRSGHGNLCPEKKSIGSAVNGGMAEYVIVPEKNLHPIPEGISLREAAMTEPLACCVQGVLEFGNICPGDRVLITGPGAIGLMCLQVAVSAGAVVIVAGTAVDKERLELAKELGAAETVYSDRPDAGEKIAAFCAPFGADIVFDCSGAGAAINMGLHVIRKGGRYVQVGLTGKPVELDMNLITLKELSVMGTYAQKPQWWVKALDLVERGEVKLEPLISDVYPLEEWKKAFDGYRHKTGFKYLLEAAGEDV